VTNPNSPALTHHGMDGITDAHRYSIIVKYVSKQDRLRMHSEVDFFSRTCNKDNSRMRLASHTYGGDSCISSFVDEFDYSVSRPSIIKN